MQRNLRLATHEVADGHGDPAAPRDRDRLQVGGRNEAGVGRERQVDDRVIGKRVEERGVLFGAALRSASREVPVAPRLTRTRPDRQVALPLDLVLDHRPTTEDLHDDARPDDQTGVAGLLGRLEHARHRDPHLRASGHRHAPRLGAHLPARHHGDDGPGVGVALVGDEDRLVGAAAGRAGSLGAVPGRRHGVGAGDGRDRGRDRVGGARRRRRAGAPHAERGRHRDAAADDQQHEEPSQVASGRARGLATAAGRRTARRPGRRGHGFGRRIRGGRARRDALLRHATTSNASTRTAWSAIIA